MADAWVLGVGQVDTWWTVITLIYRLIDSSLHTLDHTECGVPSNSKITLTVEYLQLYTLRSHRLGITLNLYTLRSHWLRITLNLYTLRSHRLGITLLLYTLRSHSFHFYTLIQNRILLKVIILSTLDLTSLWIHVHYYLKIDVVFNWRKIAWITYTTVSR